MFASHKKIRIAIDKIIATSKFSNRVGTSITAFIKVITSLPLRIVEIRDFLDLCFLLYTACHGGTLRVFSSYFIV